MPKISAATVAEHRANRRAALVRAGTELLLESGLERVTPGSVAARAGLTRPSFYDYFPSRDDLLVAIAITSMEDWGAELESALAGVPAGAAQLRRFIDATMAMSADGRHAIADVLRGVELSPKRFDDLMALHEVVMRPVHQILDSLGVSATPSTVTLVHAALGAGIELVGHGVDHRRVADDVHQLLTRGLLN